MPVSVILSPEQLDVVKQANKGDKVSVKCTTNSMQLTHENWEAVRDMLQTLHNKKFNIKTKTVDHLQTCYYAQQVLEKIATASEHFINNPLPAKNDNVVGVVEVEAPAETTDSEENNDSGNDSTD